MTTVLLVGGDLMARARLQDAASRAGAELHTVAKGALSEALVSDPPDLVVLDLDEGREPVLQELEAARSRGARPARVIGYFSHVDERLGEAARRAGCEALPRGRFWRELPRLLGGDGA